MTTFDVSQVNDLAANLERQAPRVGRLASAVLRTTAARVQRTAKQFAPVDSGALRDSITVDFYGTGNSRRQVARIGPTVPYGAIVEFGYANNPPQAFLGPALDRHTPEFVAGMEAAADTATEQALG